MRVEMKILLLILLVIVFCLVVFWKVLSIDYQAELPDIEDVTEQLDIK